MKFHVGRRLFVVAAVVGTLAVFAAAFFVALTVRSVVADPVKPNPGHEWSEIGLPPGVWSGLDADTVDGMHAGELLADADWDLTSLPDMFSIPTGNVGIGTNDPDFKLDVKGDGRFYCPDQSILTHEDSYIDFEPNLWGSCDAVAMELNEHRDHNRLVVSAYDDDYGNIIYSEDPSKLPGEGGQGLGIAGGDWMYPLERFIVNSNETFLGYRVQAGDGDYLGPAHDADGNLYVNGNVGIGTTNPVGKLDVVNGTGAQMRGIAIDPIAGDKVVFSRYLGAATSVFAKLFGTGDLSFLGKVGIGTGSPPQATLDVDGYAKLKVYSSEPVACGPAYEGSIALTSSYYLCVCDGANWKRAWDGTTPCGAGWP